jgi:hypothetical protein
MFSELAASDMGQNMLEDNDQIQEKDESKQLHVIWGRPEVPKLFASSHYCQKLLK